MVTDIELQKEIEKNYIKILEELENRTIDQAFKSGKKQGKKEAIKEVETWINNNIVKGDDPHLKWHEFFKWLNKKQLEVKNGI